MADSSAANSAGEYAAEGKRAALRYKRKAGRGPDQQSCAKAAMRLGSSGYRETMQETTVLFFKGRLRSNKSKHYLLAKRTPG